MPCFGAGGDVGWPVTDLEGVVDVLAWLHLGT
jgi:hypothetical protein